MGRRVAETAEVENFRHQVRAARDWLERAPHDDLAWRQAASSSDTLALATLEQLEDLGQRITHVLTEWSAECNADQRQRPDAVRRPVRAISRVFPSGAVRP